MILSDPKMIKASDHFVSLSAYKEIGAASQEIKTWLNGVQKFESSQCSRVHKLVNASHEKRVFEWNSQSDLKQINASSAFDDVQSIVLQHDWHGVLGEAIGSVSDHEIRLPFPRCAFEFRLSGKSVVMLCQEAELGKLMVSQFVETDVGWFHIDRSFNGEHKSTMRSVSIRQMKAVCIALDAGIAVKDLIQPPAALNAKRARRGRISLRSYHVVNLSNRSRSNESHEVETGRRLRLHFRRGHWRHFENRRTWINWMLVGNPDLGFIAKHYTI